MNWRARKNREDDAEYQIIDLGYGLLAILFVAALFAGMGIVVHLAIR